MIFQLKTRARLLLRCLRTSCSVGFKTTDGHGFSVKVRGYCGLHPQKFTPGVLNIVTTDFIGQRAKASSSAVDFSLKETALYCNEDRWQEYQEAIKIETTFIDTHYNASLSQQQSLPTILGIHDTPGCHKDMLPLLEPLACSGHRVVIVNMPGSGHTHITAKRERPFFTYTTEERTEFLIKFLSDLDLLKIDLVIGHGSGTGPITMLMASSDVFRSVLLLCPTPGHEIRESFSNLSQVEWALKMHDRPIFRLPARMVMKLLCQRSNIDLSHGNAEHIVREIVGFGYEYLPGLARSTSYKKTPLTYVLSSGDERHCTELSLQYAELFGIRRNRFITYDNENQEDVEHLASKPRASLKSGIELKKCSHSPQSDDYYKDFIIMELRRLLKEVK